MEQLAHLSHVGVSLGGKPVLSGVSLDIDAGQVIGVSGANGSGKTTLARTIATLQHHHSGTGAVLGEELGSPEIRSVRSKIGMIGHVPSLIAELTLMENLIHFARLGGVEESRVERSLEVVGLADAADRRAEQSSFGMKRRVEAAHLLLRQPQLLVLDEAISGLDAAATELIYAIIDATRDRGGATVMVSHDATHIAAVADRTFVLDTGKLENSR